MTAGPQIVVPDGILALIAREARRALPGECCGALLGERAGATCRVREALPLPNPAPAGRYAVAADSMRQVEADAGELGMNVVGFYHSHPRGPAEPSPVDLEAAWPWYTYVIVDAVTGEAQAWRLAEDRSAFERLAIQVEQQQP